MGDFEVLRLGVDDARPDFDCGDADLNEFFSVDSRRSCQELLAVTYAINQDGETVAFFSVSNDSLKREDVPRSPFARLLKKIPREKRYSSMPAVKIGRLAVNAGRQRGGMGTEVLNFIKGGWFTAGNKTGCRFVIVDAYNKPEVTAFYEKNGFAFLLGSDESESTRLMYFDLIQVPRNQATAP